MENFGNIKDTFKNLMIESLIKKDDSGNVVVSSLGQSNTYSGVKKIVARGGDGNGDSLPADERSLDDPRHRSGGDAADTVTFCGVSFLSSSVCAPYFFGRPFFFALCLLLLGDLSPFLCGSPLPFLLTLLLCSSFLQL
jgi:hypothetical protein